MALEVRRGFILAVSAPSGTGKTSLCDRLAMDFDFVKRSVSVTTREPREGEHNGRDYEFLSVEEFKRRDKAGELLETAEVFGRWYGTPRRPVVEALEKSQVIVMDIDTVGACRVRSLMPDDSVLLFVVPPSRAELEKRLKLRGKNSPAELERRLQEADREVSEAPLFDYVICNEDFDSAYEHVKAIVHAERFRSRRLSLKTLK